MLQGEIKNNFVAWDIYEVIYSEDAMGTNYTCNKHQNSKDYWVEHWCPLYSKIFGVNYESPVNPFFLTLDQGEVEIPKGLEKWMKQMLGVQLYSNRFM